VVEVSLLVSASATVVAPALRVRKMAELRAAQQKKDAVRAYELVYAALGA
jgi:hypothetical protein